MAADGTTLPVIVIEKPGASRSQPLHKLSNRLEIRAEAPLHSWGPLLSHSQPRPGDVYRRRRGASTTRPLGLLPDRSRPDAWKELTMLLSFVPPSSTAVMAPRLLSSPPPAPAKSQLETTSLEDEAMKPTITASVAHRSQQAATAQEKFYSSSNAFSSKAGAYRFSAKKQDLFRSQLDVDSGEKAEDREYLDTLAQCTMQKYYGAHESSGSRHLPAPLPHAGKTAKSRMAAGLSPQQAAVLKRLSPSAKLRRSDQLESAERDLEYLSFSEQAQLNHRHWFTDCRDGVEYEPCERCRLRGTRCSKCRAIRTGGGYIILDGLSSLTDFLANQRHTDFLNVTAGEGGGRDGRGLHGRGRLGKHEAASSGCREQWDGGDGDAGGSSHVLEGRGGGEELDARGDRDIHGGRGGEGGGGGFGSNGGGEDGSARSGSAQVRRSGTGLDASHGRSGLINLKEETEEDNMNQHQRRGNEDDRDLDEDGGREGGGRRVRQGSARPRTAKRPPSALQKGDRERRGGGKASELEKRREDLEGRRRRRRKEDGESDGEDDSDDEKRRRRRRRHASGENDDDNEQSNKGVRDLKGHYEHGGEEGGGRDLYRGELRRFKTKRDDVKALACTLKELEGIDPLDYLAKYCIIDQEKLPEYRRVFDNVDRDEDDEITIPELDFALKAVNYNLISDAEMTYVHSILELAGRYALNFRLFSLVAALSEKVVALEDMVKRLINSMDFEALEVKMKKCKELFYLLADASDEGVVTTDALAVELQAGGLTEEHVEFVVDRLNHQGKGVVEFLDYLTYVPLFVEIHDSISSNPLDFTRTK